MFKDYWKYSWILEPHRYDEVEELISSLRDSVIGPLEAKVEELTKKRNEAAS